MAHVNKQLNIELSKELHQKLKEIATHNNVSMTSIVKTGIKEYIAKNEKSVIY